MKAIMISIKPKWYALILNGDKIIEVRKGTALYKATKKLIDEYGYADIYMYCTKEEELFYSRDTQKWYVSKNRRNVKKLSNGVVKAKFRCYKVEEITKYQSLNPLYTIPACLSANEWCEYLGEKVGCAIHISDLKIFDKPKELSEFYTLKCYQKNIPCNIKYIFGVKECHRICKMCKPLTKGPQPFCYIKTEE